MPNWPAKVFLQSLVAAIDRQHEAHQLSVEPPAEAWMCSFNGQPAMVLKRRLLPAVRLGERRVGHGVLTKSGQPQRVAGVPPANPGFQMSVPKHRNGAVVKHFRCQSSLLTG